MEFQVGINKGENYFEQIVIFLQHIKNQLDGQIACLENQNLFYENFLNKHLQSKKQLVLTYMQPKIMHQEQVASGSGKIHSTQTMQSSQNSTNVDNTSISHSIADIIQKAENTLIQIQDDDPEKTKVPKPSLNPYKQQPSQQPGVIYNQKSKKEIKEHIAKQQESQSTIQEKKPPVPKQSVVKAKVGNQKNVSTNIQQMLQPNTKTQRSSSQKASARSSLQAKSDQFNKQDQELNKCSFVKQRSQDLTQKNMQQDEETQQEQHNKSLVQQTNIKLNKTKQYEADDKEQIEETKSINKLEQKQLGLHLDNEQEENTNKDNATASIHLEQFKNLNLNLSVTNKQKIEKYYQLKKEIAENKKEYINTSKYYQKNLEVCKNKFINKLYSHLEERKKAIQLNIKEKIQNQSSQQGEEDTEQENRNNQQCYTQLNNKFLQQLLYEEKDMCIKLSALCTYSSLMLAFIEKVSILDIKNLQEILQNPDQQNDIIKMFRVWYFAKILSENIVLLNEIVKEESQRYQSIQLQMQQSFLQCIKFQKTGELSQNKRQDIVIDEHSPCELLSQQQKRTSSIPEWVFAAEVFEKEKKIVINFRQKVCNTFGNNNYGVSGLLNVEGDYEQMKICLNKYKFQSLMAEVLRESAIKRIQMDFQSLMKKQLDINQFKYLLTQFATLISMVEYKGKLIPSFISTETLKYYLSNMKQESNL